MTFDEMVARFPAITIDSWKTFVYLDPTDTFRSIFTESNEHTVATSTMIEEAYNTAIMG